MAVGNLAPRKQANTHDEADTDAAVSSIHHTIGASALKAAAGNHDHGAAPWTGQVIKAADATRTNTIAPTPDPDFVINVDANGLYLIELLAAIYADNNGVVNGALNADLRWRFTCGGGAALKSQIAANGLTIGRTTAGVTQIAMGGAVRDTAHYPNQDQTHEMTHQEVSTFFFRGLVPFASAGTFVFEWAQAAANLSIITLKAGSVLRWQKLGSVV